MKRAIIFDFGGVLMKTQDYQFRHAWDTRLGLPLGSVERVVHGSQSWRLAQVGALSVDDYWADVAQQLHLSTDDLDQLQADFFKGDQLDPALMNYIRQLRTWGHRVALLSNDAPSLQPKLEALGISALFDPLVISAHIGVMKPAPQAYQAVLDRLKLPAAQTVFIDDMLPNIEAAQALGIQAIHYRPDVNLPQVMESYLETE